MLFLSAVILTPTATTGITDTVKLALLEHPFASVPVTVYVVEVPGLTVLVSPEPRLLFQLYVYVFTSPDALSVLELPRQIEEGVAVAEIVGF